MKPLRVVVTLLFMLCLLIVPQAANAQYSSGGNIFVSTQILYDEQTGYVLAEGGSGFYTPFAEVFTGGAWDLTLDLYGPQGYIDSGYSSMYLNGNSYAYVETDVDESGYGEYTAYTDVIMQAGSLDYLGFYYFGFSGEGFQQVTVDGGPYYPGMPCYDEWLGYYLNGPCYPYPPAPYTTEPTQVATSRASRTINGPSLTCTSSVTRGGTATCSIRPPSGVTAKDWEFTDGNTPPVIRSTEKESLTWSGTMATSGTVQVTATIRGTDTPLTASIVVTNRTNFAFTAVAPSERSNPYIGGACNIGVPISPAAGNNVGYSCLDQQFFQKPYLIGDNGPNHGFRYVYSALSSSNDTNSGVPTAFNFIVAGYLKDSGSEFAQKQCGNYNPRTNTGYISWTQLKSNTYEHESGSTTGHYASYKSTQDNPANNIGVAVEAVVGPPGQTETAFINQVRALADFKATGIASASFPMPETLTTFCNSDVRRDPSCVFRGYINWPLYASCQ